MDERLALNVWERRLIELGTAGFWALTKGLSSPDSRIAARAGYLMGKFPLDAEAALADDQELLGRYLAYRWWGLLWYEVPRVDYRDPALRHYQRRIESLRRPPVDVLIKALEENDAGCSLFKGGGSPEMHICTGVIQMLEVIGDERAIPPLEVIAAGRPNWHKLLIDDAQRALRKLRARASSDAAPDRMPGRE